MARERRKEKATDLRKTATEVSPDFKSLGSNEIVVNFSLNVAGIHNSPSHNMDKRGS